MLVRKALDDNFMVDTEEKKKNYKNNVEEEKLKKINDIFIKYITAYIVPTQKDSVSFSLLLIPT